MSAESNPTLRAVVAGMMRDPEAMAVGLPKLLTGSFPNLNEDAGPPGFPWGGRIVYFWPRGEDAQRALARGLAGVIQRVPEQLESKQGQNLLFNALFLAGVLKSPSELLESLQSFPRDILPPYDPEDPLSDDFEHWLDTAIEKNTPET